ncbi:MAG: two-component sensor histidine kinase, partial [Gammaproteobacteria bacterium]|nr:two-component sensor histidine kinase [Gammaproteobacteria bacterium]
FYRSEQGEEQRSNSSGLGLAIVKRILDLHGSRITVESTLNEGTRFEFDIPARAA